VDEALNGLMVQVLEIKRIAKAMNIGDDDMETMILEALESAGIGFSS
jgi:hypothetical protein